MCVENPIKGWGIARDILELEQLAHRYEMKYGLKLDINVTPVKVKKPKFFVEGIIDKLLDLNN